METLLNLEDYTIAADEVENRATARSDWQGWAIGDRFQIPRKIKKFSKLFGIWTVTDLWQSGKNAMLTISDGLRTLNQPVKELDLSWKIEDGVSQRESGLLISFGHTLEPLLQGIKFVTRRKWQDSHAAKFIRAFDNGLKIRAFDKDRRYGGQHIGWLRLTQKPYRERLADMPEAGVTAEGFPELTKTEFLDRFFKGDADLTVWVIRFEFEPLQPLPSLVSESADGEAAPESVSPAVEEPTSVAVEVLPVDPPAIVGEACVERIDELSYEEERDRLHLERKVERAFYEAGRALRELRDRRLYRSTHKTFEAYCQERFGFSRIAAHYKIAAIEVVENLLTNGYQNETSESALTNGSQNASAQSVLTNSCQNSTAEEMLTNGYQNPPTQDLLTNGRQTEMLTNGRQILPTNERQVRSLVQLEPEQQREAWQQAVTEAGGKVPSGRIVKDIVERMQQVESPPESIVRAHHLTLEPGGLVEVRCPGNKTIHSRYGRIAKVTEKTVEVWVRDTETMMMVKHTLKHHQVEAVPLENEPGLKELCDRIARLRECQLDPFDREILELLDRAVVLTPREVEVLEGIEGRVF